MNTYITGAVIRRLREEKKLTQAELAAKLLITDKTVSKWENGHGYPDITLLEPLAAALGISVPELLSGTDIRNRNRSSNMLRSKFYVCPVCGNVLTATGELSVSCCGVTLVPEESEQPDEAHRPTYTAVEDEWYVEWKHPMERGHFISFAAALGDDRVELTKLYPEGPAEVRIKRGRNAKLFWYCNRDGLFCEKLP